MRKSAHILCILLACMPILLYGQTPEKYLIGAVPEVDGKVVFSRSYDLTGATQEAIYDRAYTWAEERMKANDNKSRIVYSDKEKGSIVATGEEYIVFTASSLSLDRTIANYQLTISCKPGGCLIEIEKIRYVYQEKEKYTAEEYITDKVALNKNKTDIYRGYKKFRIKTIDFADEMFESAAAAFGIQKVVAVAQPTVQPLVPVATAAPAATTEPAHTLTTTPVVTTPVVTAVPAVAETTPVATVQPSVSSIPSIAATPAPSAANLAGYKQIAPDKIPGNIIKMLGDDWMLITAGNDEKFNMMTASWGGLGRLYEKPVAICFINPMRYTYQLMEKNDTYTLTFYTEAYRDALRYCGSNSGKSADKVKGSGLTPVTTPEGSKAFSEAWLIIECRKLVSQSLTPEAISNEEVKEQWAGKQLHKMFIGEIINVWVK